MKYLAFLSLILSVCFTNAQSVILFEKDSISEIYENVDISENFTDFGLDLFFKNNTDEEISVGWRREFSENCPLEWNVVSIDQFYSYVWGINESQNPIPMSPVDSNFIIRQLFYPRMVPGCCDVKIIFYLEEEPENSIDTAYYHIEINADGCLSTSISNTEYKSLILHPNPSSDIVRIVSDESFQSVHVYDISGTLMYTSYSNSTSNIDVSSLAPGVYYCKLQSETGLLYSHKIVKE